MKTNSPPLVGDFTRSGYAVVRDKDSMLFVTGMAYTLTHKHADDLSFVLFEHSRLIFIDSGKYGYNSDPMRRYVESAAAHNPIGLADQEIRSRDITLTGSELMPVISGEGQFRVAGQAERPGLFKQTRDPVRAGQLSRRARSSPFGKGSAIRQ